MWTHAIPLSECKVEQVHQHFAHTLLLARELVAVGATDEVLTEVNLMRARRLNEAFDDDAPDCDTPAALGPRGRKGPGHHDHMA